MTGRAPDSALDLVLWTGVRLEDANVVEAGIEQVNQHCDRLQSNLDVMYEELKENMLEGEIRRQRDKVPKEANNHLAHPFEVGDLIMVTVADAPPLTL